MDNFRIDVTADGEGMLRKAMEIAFSRHRKAVAYLVSDEKGLVFFWSADGSDPRVTRLPFTLDAEGASDFARRWLAEADYGKEPGHDGSNKRGFRVYNEDWTRVGGWTYSFVAVQPAWAWYGK